MVQTTSELKLPILDDIDQNITVGTTGSFMAAVQSAVKLLDWGINTGLDPVARIQSGFGQILR